MSQSSEPIDFGEEGLAFSFPALWFYSPTAEPQAQDASGVAAVGLLDHSGSPTTYYCLTGLPDPPPGKRATLAVSTPARDLAYSYGPPPVAPPTVWRAQFRVAANDPVTTADSLGRFAVEVQGMPDPSAASAIFRLFDPASSSPVIPARPAAVSGVVQSGRDGSFGFTLSYDLEIAYPLPPGSFRGEFEIDYGGGLSRRLPGGDELRVLVREANP